MESRDDVEPLELFEPLEEPDDALFSELAAPSPCAELPRSRFESLDEPLLAPPLVLSDFELLSRSPIDMPPDAVNVAELSW